MTDVAGTIERDRELRALRDAAAASLRADPAHDMHHLLRVAAWTVRIGAAGVCRREAIAAALLHDFAAVEKNSAQRMQASEMSANAAVPLLARNGFEPEAIERIAGAIVDHSYSRGSVPSSALGRALQDADRLDALGSLGILRAISTGTRMGSAWLDYEDPWAARRGRDDRTYAIDHFFSKLLKLPATMQTAEGREEARRRVEVMHTFLGELGREIGVPIEMVGE